MLLVPYSYPLCFVSLSHLDRLYSTSLSYYPNVSIHNVLQYIPDHTLSFSPSSQFIPCLTSATSAKVLSAFTLTGSFLNGYSIDFDPCCILGPLMPKQLVCGVESALDPHSENVFSVNWGGRERATRYTHQPSPPTPLGKWTLYSCVTISIAASPLSSANWILNEFTHPDGSAVLLFCCRCQPTRIELIVLSCMVVSAFLSCPFARWNICWSISALCWLCFLWAERDGAYMLPSARVYKLKVFFHYCILHWNIFIFCRHLYSEVLILLILLINPLTFPLKETNKVLQVYSV